MIQELSDAVRGLQRHIGGVLGRLDDCRKAGGAVPPDLQREYDEILQAINGVIHTPVLPLGRQLQLDIDPGTRARCLHRVVRAMHDGSCPRCGHLGPSDSFDRGDEGHVCPACGFEVGVAEARAALDEFLPLMRESLDVFEAWRAERRQSPGRPGL